MNHYVLIERATGRLIGTAPILEAALVQRNVFKAMISQGITRYVVFDNDPDVEIRVYDEP
jgi:hypothetical protein